MNGEERILNKLNEIDGRLAGVEASNTNLTRNQDKIINELVEAKAYLHEKVATKDELNVAKTEIMTHIDGFAKRQETFDHELVSTRHRMDRLEGKA